MLVEATRGTVTSSYAEKKDEIRAAKAKAFECQLVSDDLPFSESVRISWIRAITLSILAVVLAK
jgi:hypothetical protein